MEAAPYYAPTYFPASYFYSATVSVAGSNPAVPSLYNAPTYFAPSYFSGQSATMISSGVSPYNAPTYFAPSYFSGPSSTPTGSGVSPYNAPTYFAPSYFSGSPMPVEMGMTPYNAPTYFAPAYFYSLLPATTVVTVGTDPISPSNPVELDEESYLALMNLVKGTGAFEDVILGFATQRSQAGADTYPLAVLTPRGWEESDDYDPTSIVRRTTFSITVVVKTEDDVAEFEALERLSTAIKRVVDGSDLDGRCLPQLTRIYSGHFLESARHPEQAIELKGEFSRLINF